MAKNTLTLQEAYALLDVARSAGIDEVKQAYRKRAFALHPDLHPDNENAAMEFQRVNEAYVTVITYLDSQAKKNSAKAQFVNAEKARKSKFEEEMEVSSVLAVSVVQYLHSLYFFLSFHL